MHYNNLARLLKGEAKLESIYSGLKGQYCKKVCRNKGVAKRERTTIEFEWGQRGRQAGAALRRTCDVLKHN